MPNRETIAAYGREARDRADKYDSLRFEEIHSSLLDLLPQGSSLVLDVGAGSGRDAAWFAQKGYEVVAVEPSGMLAEARNRHISPRIQWVQDSLPALKKTRSLGYLYDFILLSAVWMHILPKDRKRAFRNLTKILRPGGRLVVSLRHGPSPADRRMYPVSSEELASLSREHGQILERVTRGADEMGRDDVTWETVCIQSPDDGTAGLPLLRNIILNDHKSSTYKLALLRVLARIADSGSGSSTRSGDTVGIPLGLVALYWLRSFLPLAERGYRQWPRQIPRPSPEGFSPYDLSIGQEFEGERGRTLMLALRGARQTICRMPATFITYPNSDRAIFSTETKQIRGRDSLCLNDGFLREFGYLRMPISIWESLSRYSVWIEPALVDEWIGKITAYHREDVEPPDPSQIRASLQWHDPEHKTSEVRRIVTDLLDGGKSVFCVWSGKRLRTRFEIDHCLPFSSWPCNDLWNLLPATIKVNRAKLASLPSAASLDSARDRILVWWETAYLRRGEATRKRFGDEVKYALSGVSDPFDCEEVFEALNRQRARLRRDQQIQEWDLGGDLPP